MDNYSLPNHALYEGSWSHDTCCETIQIGTADTCPSASGDQTRVPMLQNGEKQIRHLGLTFLSVADT